MIPAQRSILQMLLVSILCGKYQPILLRRHRCLFHVEEYLLRNRGSLIGLSRMYMICTSLFAQHEINQPRLYFNQPVVPFILLSYTSLVLISIRVFAVGHNPISDSDPDGQTSPRPDIYTIFLQHHQTCDYHMRLALFLDSALSSEPLETVILLEIFGKGQGMSRR